MSNENKILTYATAFTVTAGGLLLLSLIPSVIGIRQVQKSTAFNMFADGHRQISLAKSYDAKAAALSIKTIATEII